MDNQNKEKLRIRINAKKIMQELMDEKISHNLPLEKLLGEESKNRHRSKKREESKKQHYTNVEPSDSENNDEYITLNSTKYANLYNPRREGADNYQIAPKGNYNYYPNNLTKRVNLNNSSIIPSKSNHESSLMMNNSNEFTLAHHNQNPK